jgi:transposase InsO family protein
MNEKPRLNTKKQERVTLSESAVLKLNTWQDQVTSLLRGTKVSMSDLTNWVVSRQKPDLAQCYDIKLYRTPPRCPNCNAFIERWNRSIREECLDHRIVFGARDLHRLVAEYVDYFNHYRPHQSLGQNSPLKNHETKPRKILHKICRKKLVDGLITNFSLAA